jgi:DNA-binding PadR family transcriptional regulator
MLYYNYSVQRYIDDRNIDSGVIYMKPTDFLPLSEVSFYILLSLKPEAKHGYAIWKDVESMSKGSIKLSTSTLYDALERLLKQGLIERVEEHGRQSSARPRKRYQLNDLGRQALGADINRMRVLLDLAAPRFQEVPR